jgi:hypothetical protein
MDFRSRISRRDEEESAVTVTFDERVARAEPRIEARTHFKVFMIWGGIRADQAVESHGSPRPVGEGARLAVDKFTDALEDLADR